ncbi:hypothetical protein DLAC_08438 [Tieghemostelium lacteum]|uniref:Pesticidal crystal protein domain-containing protein n=1 Tax=Tieghemostelium lacteum TaxID=361077 RepID=A0A151ZC03_TIELA|nr:hypothetical protein DLAC_08438 [Tieghemostelium lacteum]|eukprot:KYQ91471.1 hypothetical protein DLAC_08438 [Tieghemostelium lacteum]
MVLNQKDYIDIYSKTVNDLFNEIPLSAEMTKKPPIEFMKALVVGSLSMVPGAGPILGMLADCILSQLIDDKNAAESEQAFANFQKAIVSIIDSKIASYDIGSIQTALSGTTKQMATFKGYVKNALAYPNKPSYKEFVRTEIVALDNIFMDKIAKCQNKDNDLYIVQLPYYVILVTAYLGLLADTVQRGAKWGILEGTRTQFVGKFNEQLAEAKQWVWDTYKAGIAKIQSSDTTNDVRKFNKIIRFRNQFIYFAFDFFPIWEAMDPIKYPEPVRFEQVRFLFSDIEGFPVQDATNKSPYYRLTMDQIEDKFYYYNYNAYGGDLAKIAQFKQADNNRIIAIQNYFYRNPATKDQVAGALLGGNNTNIPSWVSDMPEDCVPQQVVLNHDIIPRLLCISNSSNFPLNTQGRFGISTGRNQDSGNAEQTVTYSYPYNSYNFPVTLPNNDPEELSEYDYTYNPVWKYENTTYQFPDHKIAHIASIGANKDINSNGVVDAFLVAYAPVNLFRYNYIYPTGTTIVQAQKCVGKDNGVSLSISHFINNPCHHLWSMTVGPSKYITFAFDAVDSTVTKFNFCFRYTSNGPATIAVFNVATATGVGNYQLPASATETYSSVSTFAINIGNQPFGKNRFRFTNNSTTTTIQLINISLTPKPATTTAA